MALCTRVELNGQGCHIAPISDIAPVASYTALNSTGHVTSSYIDQNWCYVSYIDQNWRYVSYIQLCRMGWPISGIFLRIKGPVLSPGSVFADGELKTLQFEGFAELLLMFVHDLQVVAEVWHIINVRRNDAERASRTTEDEDPVI
jgi:hypothetical protein